jgi:hypothetical protein
VCDDFELATALGMDPSNWKYSETKDATAQHIAKLARQEVKDLEKRVNQNAKAAYFRIKE